MTNQQNNHRYHGPERRAMPLSDDQIEEIAERAAERAVEKLRAEAYQGVGRWAVGRAMWVFGIAVVALWWWLARNGFIKT